MNIPEVDIQAAPVFSVDIPEIKKQVLYRDVDESLSEWERARMTSKTWSMEQD
tara:strand:- start:56407 stop:56565 length:159 start_codon:yes stop_codon:yes gene_type:complete